MDDVAAIAIVPPEVSILGIPSREAAGVWPLVVGYVEPVIELAGGAYSTADTLAEIQTTDTQLWVAMVDGELKGCVISRIVKHPQLSELFCLVVGGEHVEDWGEPMFARLEEFARAKGCARIEGVGRRGWARVLPGMKEVASLMRKVL